MKDLYDKEKLDIEKIEAFAEGADEPEAGMLKFLLGYIEYFKDEFKKLEEKCPYIKLNICPILEKQAGKIYTGIISPKEAKIEFDEWPEEPEAINECQVLSNAQPGRITRFFWRLLGIRRFGIPNLEDKGIPPMPRVRPPKSWPRPESKNEYPKGSNGIVRCKDFRKRFLAAARQSEAEGKVKIIELIDEAENILDELS